MPAAAKCDAEEDRVAALRRYNVLDTPPESDFDDITRLIARICQTPIAVVNLIDRDRQFFKSECGLGVRETPLDISICAHAILQPGVMVVPDTRQDARFADNPLVTGEPGLRFYAGALLETSDGFALGTLCVLDYEPRTITDEQKDALQILARQVMALLEMRRHYDRERKIAETLQRAMLLRPAEDQYPGLLVAPLYEAARAEADIGGDFFDTFALPSGHVALVVGDVAGKGLTAAARTAEVKFAFRVYVRESASLADAMTRLNRFLLEMQQTEGRAEDVFVAMSAALVEPASGRVEVCAAGAELPLVARHDGRVEAVGQHGLPLGVDTGAHYDGVITTLDARDYLVLLTDGITEARQAGALFGDEGVEQALRQSPAHDPASLALHLHDAARAFAGGALRDDACILIARRTV